LLALSGQINCARVCPLLDGGLNGSTQHFIFEGKDGAGESLESVSDEKAARRYRRMIVPAGTYTASVTACGHGRMMIHVDDASDPHVDMYGLTRHPFWPGLGRKDDFDEPDRTGYSTQTEGSKAR
jgi:hypothetical protein